jgi:hypothetical protein
MSRLHTAAVTELTPILGAHDADKVGTALERAAKTVPCGHCSRKFTDDNAVRQHVRHRHPHVKGVKRASQPVRAVMDPDDAYTFVDALDLPDGAHWAMIEEMTGLEPADFAFMGDES